MTRTIEEMSRSSSPVMIRHLSDIQRPRANCFYGDPIASITDVGSIAPSGKYKKVEGLVFDSECPNFNPSDWKYPIGKDIDHMDLDLCAGGYDGVNNVISYRLHIHRNTNRDTSMLFSICEDIADKYSGVRGKGWGGVGDMFSAGYNVGYKGRISPVALSSKMKRLPLSAMHSVTNRLSIAGGIFHEEFGDKNVGFDEMVKLQTEMWPKNRDRPRGPACWIVSQDLGNPEHVDDDYSRSYAGWFTKQDIDDASAWFLFPDWGVAIELSNDTWISWDGVHCGHCSSVPHLGETNHIYSLFTAITKKVSGNAERVNSCEALLQERVLFHTLSVNDMVSLRWVQPLDGGKQSLCKRARRKYGYKYRRWLHCVVQHINHVKGTVKLRERNKNKRKLSSLTKSQIHNSVVKGWV
jgi:hypothetical protein